MPRVGATDRLIMKTVLITGASRGIGAETARTFARQGYTVFINYNRSHEQAQQLKKELNDQGLDAHLLQADVTNESQVKQMFDYVKKYAKKLDVLVLNAGVSLYQQVQNVTEHQYNSVMDVNAKGAFFCAKHAVPLMLDRFSGSIVAVSSVWGLKGASCESVYSMSKFALVGLSMSLHEELNESGICVNCVCPPIVETDMTQHLSKEDKQQFSKQHNLPILAPSQVAETIFQVATSGQSGQIITKF